MQSSLSEVIRKYSAAIVTGGSSGLGRAFIRNARTVHPDLCICNLSRTAPENFSSGKGLHHIPCDLARASDVEHAARQVLGWLERTPSGRVLLINNSGFGTYGPFHEANLERTLEMLDVNMRGAVSLTGRLLPTLRTRGADIMNIASTAAFLPLVYSAAYGASKAFLLHWSLALGEELKDTNIHVIAVCPGTTKTDFFRRANFAEATLQGRFMQTADEVVGEAMAALQRGKTQVITGWKNRVMIRAASVLPKPLVTRLAARIMRRYWEKQPRE